MSKKKLALALQGGGSHGAYTWGVLERLLEEDRFDIRGFCGASAGALNAALATYGMISNGNKGAIEALNNFWTHISSISHKSLMQPSFLDEHLSPGSLDFSPSYYFINHLLSIVSPYDIDPVDENTNHLKEILEDCIDFKVLQKSKIPLFVSATNVLTSKPKIFGPKEITIDTLMASTAVPLLYKAAKIKGEYFWDGAFLCNPQIDPLINYTDTDDVLIIKVSPVEIDFIPKAAREVHLRVGQISSHASLMAEMKMLYFKNRMVDKGFDMGGKLRKIHFHEITADYVLDDLSLSSKINYEKEFLCLLRDRGRDEAQKWLDGDAACVGKESSLDLEKNFL